jgi:hypothetical protein
MKRLILRWLGGSGGDTLLYILNKQNKFYTNVSFPSTDLSDKDSTPTKGSANKEYPTFDNSRNYDAKPFIDDLKALSKRTNSFIIKQHFANDDIDRKIGQLVDIVNVGFDLNFLPFVVRANLQKTETVNNRNHPEKTYLDETLRKINTKLTPEQTYALTIWNLVIHNKEIMEKFRLSTSPLMLNNFFHDPGKIENFFKDKGFALNLDAQYFRNWKKRNTNLLSSNRFQNYLKNMQFDYTDKNLDLTERYVFLALSGKKFQYLV